MVGCGSFSGTIALCGLMTGEIIDEYLDDAEGDDTDAAISIALAIAFLSGRHTLEDVHEPFTLEGWGAWGSTLYGCMLDTTTRRRLNKVLCPHVSLHMGRCLCYCFVLFSPPDQQRVSCAKLDRCTVVGSRVTSQTECGCLHACRVALV